MPDPISWSFSWPYYAMALAFGYLCGSIPFGLILTKLGGTQDIRSIGSGNIGATNVLRTGRKGLAAGTLLGDALKGTVAVLVAGLWGPWLAIIAGFGAFLGHLFPVWLGFKGGKGVATYIGVLAGLWWPGMLIFAAVWLAVAFLTKYSSLAALTASVITPLALFLGRQREEAELFLVLTILLIIMHRDNISRLLSGTEGRIGQKG
jgi:acyl phosphate:glycerol-3-phosphate acyltransferase